MNCNDDRFHSRKSPRLPHFDYTLENYYFITICTYSKACIFGSPNDLNTYGKIAQQGIGQIREQFPDVRIDKFVVMPNHVHAIVCLSGGGSNLSTVIGLYKSFVTGRIRKREPGKKVWQTSFHDHVICNQAAYEKIWLYIDANPDNWGKDCFFQAQNLQERR